MKVSSFDSFQDLLDIDPYFSSIMTVVWIGERTDFLLHDGFLFKGNQLCVPDCSLRLWIIKEFHGEGGTLQLVRKSYFWPTMRKEVERCRICHVSKGKATNVGLYMPYLFQLNLGRT